MRDTVATALRDHQPAQRRDRTTRPGYTIWIDCCSGCDWEGDDHQAHLAEVVTEAVMSWDTLIHLVDKHYPADIFPTMEDIPNRDPGPRIISLLRQLSYHRAFVKALVTKSERFICPVCEYLFDECECGVGADNFAASIQDELGVSQRGEQQ